MHPRAEKNRIKATTVKSQNLKFHRYKPIFAPRTDGPKASGGLPKTWNGKILPTMAANIPISTAVKTVPAAVKESNFNWFPPIPP